MHLLHLGRYHIYGKLQLCPPSSVCLSNKRIYINQLFDTHHGSNSWFHVYVTDLTVVAAKVWVYLSRSPL